MTTIELLVAMPIDRLLRPVAVNSGDGRVIDVAARRVVEGLCPDGIGAAAECGPGVDGRAARVHRHCRTRGRGAGRH